MRKLSHIVAGILTIALLTAPAFAMQVKTLTYNEAKEEGRAQVIDDDGVKWTLHFRDNAIGLGTPGQFDPGIDYVTAVKRHK